MTGCGRQGFWLEYASMAWLAAEAATAITAASWPPPSR